jgi:hypothetical protein
MVRQLLADCSNPADPGAECRRPPRSARRWRRPARPATAGRPSPDGMLYYIKLATGYPGLRRVGAESGGARRRPRAATGRCWTGGAAAADAAAAHAPRRPRGS